MNFPWTATFAGIAVALLAVVIYLASSRLRAAREESRVVVAAAPEAPRGRLADMLERIEALETASAGHRRKLEELEVSWTRRWGTLARGMRRDRAADDAAAAVDGDGDGGDVETLPLPFAPQPNQTHGNQPRLIPMRARR